MFVVAVTVFVKQERVDDFIEAVLINARHTREEEGNARFDVSQSVDDPTRFLLYEVYRREEDFHMHQRTEHYLHWRETVADWMSRPRVGVKHYGLFPESERW